MDRIVWLSVSQHVFLKSKHTKSMFLSIIYFLSGNPNLILKQNTHTHKQWSYCTPNCVWWPQSWQMGLQRTINLDLLITTYGLLAVTTLTTKVSTRYIHSPLRCIRHISPPALEINEQQIIYGKYTLCWITVAGDHGDLYRSLTTQIMHSQHLQSDRWLTLRRSRYRCMSLYVVACLYRNATSIYNLISSPRSKQ